MKKIGLIGFGTIGQHIYEDIKNDAEIAFIFDVKEPDLNEVKKLWIFSTEEMEKKCKQGVDLVVEAAISKSVIALAPIILKYTDMMAFSTTAFAEEGFKEMVDALCDEYHHTFYIPHGAILGLDGVFDGRKVLQPSPLLKNRRT